MAENDNDGFKKVLPTNEFEKKFQVLVGRAWQLQERVAELKEFEEQWSALFALLEKRAGHECEVHIRNYQVFRSFRWDRYHILTSDLLSLLNNELETDNPDGAIKLSASQLVIHDEDHYLDLSRPVQIEDLTEPKLTDEQRGAEILANRKHFAKLTRDGCIEAYERLFPNSAGDEDVPSRAARLVSQVRSLAKKTKGIRNYFAHKHEDGVATKYRLAAEKMNIDDLDKVTERVFRIIKDIGRVYNSSGYASHSPNFERHIQDQLDIIIFGSIDTALTWIYEFAESDDYLWQARKKFWASEKILDLIANRMIPEIDS